MYQRYQQLLKQRNAALKLSRRLTAFDNELAQRRRGDSYQRQRICRPEALSGGPIKGLGA